MENSIEEDIEILEELRLRGYAMLLMKYEDRIKTNRKIDQAIEHILSDYKRVLKDIEGWKKYCEEIEEEQTKMSNKNCELEFEVEKLQKENEELKQDRNNNYKMIALAQNKALGYMQGYEDGKKLKKSALTYIEENQQYYIIKKEIEHYKKYIEKLQKENEELKEINNELEAEKNETIRRYNFETIPIKKVKDKIEELKKEGNYRTIDNPYGRVHFMTEGCDYKIQVLQELIEEREEK